jgi:hypothetical protein
MSSTNSPFDPETLALLKAVFEEACALVPLRRRTHEMRSALAVRILRRAAEGERDPTRLRTYALSDTAERHPNHLAQRLTPRGHARRGSPSNLRKSVT